jgi:hypothetical protein
MNRNTGRKATITAMRILTAGAFIIGCLSTAAHADPSPRCQQTALHAALSPASPTRYRVIGWLCTPTDRRAPTTVQILVSGLTYDHRYWDLPYQPDQYSYVHAALSRGNTVFNIDRIGVGQSDRPTPADVTVSSQAYVTHQIIQALRQGAVDGTRFHEVLGVGHSIGAAIWLYEAATWHDADGLILTSYLHQPNPAQQRAIAATLHPANQDPTFVARALPPGYLTTIPGSRLSDFYYPPWADSRVVAIDEALKQTETTGERASVNLARDPTYSRSIQVPVLLVVGRNDSLGCDPTTRLMCTNAIDICARETPYYPHATHLAALVVPGGHSINLHRSAAQWFDAANMWVDQQRIGGTSPGATPDCPHPRD